METEDRFTTLRRQLVQTLRREGIQDETVLAAVEAIPRHYFVHQAFIREAYEDEALPIELEQTISQPYMVARMTEALCQGERLQSVLEIGTGTGYQAAVLSQLVDTVYSVERIQSLATSAKYRLKGLGIENVLVRCDDGNQGWPEKAPFPGIMVTAAPTKTPLALLEQLAVGGRMVIPVGERDDQLLCLITRHEDRFEQTVLERVKFVPLLPGLQ